MKNVLLLLFLAITSLALPAHADNSFALRLISELQNKNQTVRLYGEFDGVPHAGVLYSAVPNRIDWSQGHSTVFVGKRKSAISALNYILWIGRHIDFVRRAFKPHGLRGYLFAVTADYEIAYQNWDSATAANNAFASNEGKSIVVDAGRFMDSLFFSEVRTFDWLNNLR